MIDYQPLTPPELEYMRKSDQRILRRAAAEIGVRRAAADVRIGLMVIFCLVVFAAILYYGPRERVVAAAPPKVCEHVTEQLRMARTYLARAQPGDVDSALLVIGAVAPTAGFCRNDDAVTHALERAARGDRERAFALVEAVLRSDRR